MTQSFFLAHADWIRSYEEPDICTQQAWLHSQHKALTYDELDRKYYVFWHHDRAQRDDHVYMWTALLDPSEHVRLSYEGVLTSVPKGISTAWRTANQSARTTFAMQVAKRTLYR